MTNLVSNLDSSSSYSGKNQVVFCNGNVLNISHIGTSSLINQLPLHDVLAVPHLVKNLFSISKLIRDSPVDILFSNNFFAIQNRSTKEIIARGKVEGGLYILEQGHKTFLVSLRNKRTSASYELWHSRLGHVTFEIIYLLQKLGSLSLTVVLPKLGVCSFCQLSKSKRLPFHENYKRVTHVLDLIHCDLWGPTHLPSADGYLYYVIFVDGHYRFTWFYPLKLKSDFAQIFTNFLLFVQNQFSCKVKKFQTDRGLSL